MMSFEKKEKSQYPQYFCEKVDDKESLTQESTFNLIKLSSNEILTLARV